MKKIEAVMTLFLVVDSSKNLSAIVLFEPKD
jgi:hypothetical protein